MGGMGAGAGAGQARKMSEPDKKVTLPSVPNEEAVRGEVERRQTVSIADASTKAPTREGSPPRPGTPRRRVAMPTESEGDRK